MTLNDLPVADLAAIYAHADSLMHLVDAIPSLVPLAAELETLVLRIEFVLQSADPLVDRQPLVIRSESLEVQ